MEQSGPSKCNACYEHTTAHIAHAILIIELSVLGTEVQEWSINLYIHLDCRYVHKPSTTPFYLTSTEYDAVSRKT